MSAGAILASTDETSATVPAPPSRPSPSCRSLGGGLIDRGNDMDYALLPPEVNSARMYAGPGSGPMMAAASAWDALAADLQSTASSYQSAITTLIAGPWLGPSAATMAAAAAPYVDWMRATAAQAEQDGESSHRAGGRGQSQSVGGPGCNQFLRPEHPVHRRHRNAVFRDVGPRRFRDVQLCRRLGVGDDADTVQFRRRRPPTRADRGARRPRPPKPAPPPPATFKSAMSQAQQAFSAVPSALSSAAAPAQALSPLDLINLLGSLSGILVDPELSAAGLVVDSRGPSLRRRRRSHGLPHG